VTWLPVCIGDGGSWLIASVCMVRMKHMSSTIRDVYGNNSDVHMPHCPWREKRNFDGAIGKRAWPDVMVVRRCPMRTESGRSTS